MKSLFDLIREAYSALLGIVYDVQFIPHYWADNFIVVHMLRWMIGRAWRASENGSVTERVLEAILKLFG